jgi:group I intron endonuclease
MAIGTTLKCDHAGIYRIDIGSRFYYGSSRNIRKRISGHFHNLRNGKHGNQIMQNAFKKHGDFKFCVVEEVTNIDRFPLALIESEQAWINSAFGDPLCMNISPTAGNCHGVKHTAEAKERMSKAKIGLQCGIFHPRYGKTWSDEQRAKYSQTRTGTKFSTIHKRNHLRSVRKPESRKKVSDAQRGRVHTPEHIESRMKNMRGADNVAAKKIWLEHESFGRQEFGCSKEAAIAIGVGRSLISRWILGVRPWPGEGKIKRKKTSHLVGLKGGYL